MVSGRLQYSLVPSKCSRENREQFDARVDVGFKRLKSSNGKMDQLECPFLGYLGVKDEYRHYPSSGESHSRS